jgi:hypothetical protein
MEYAMVVIRLVVYTVDNINSKPRKMASLRIERTCIGIVIVFAATRRRIAGIATNTIKPA